MARKASNMLTTIGGDAQRGPSNRAPSELRPSRTFGTGLAGGTCCRRGSALHALVLLGLDPAPRARHPRRWPTHPGRVARRLEHEGRFPRSCAMAEQRQGPWS
jgi:hypothetical protein